MKVVPPITFEEELNMLKSNFLTILDKYEACKKTCRLRGCPQCENFSKQLNDIINIKCDELKKNVATATINLDTVISAVLSFVALPESIMFIVIYSSSAGKI